MENDFREHSSNHADRDVPTDGIFNAFKEGRISSDDVFDAFKEFIELGRLPRGQDIGVIVELFLDEAYTGVEREFTFDRPKICATCQGARGAQGSSQVSCKGCDGSGRTIKKMGNVNMQQSCPECSGHGTLPSIRCQDCAGIGFTNEKVTRSVKIPPGVDDQMNVALPGEGCPSLKGDPPGDLVCSIQLQPHPFWRRYGSQLSTRYSITYSQAVLGAELELPTLSGPEAFKIPPGTAADQAFRIRNRGMPDPNGGPPGDLTIETFLEVPTRISREYKTLLQRIAEIEQPKIARRRNAPLQQVEKPVSGCDSADPKREDNQQHFRLPISYTEAVLGARVDLPSFAGAKSIKIPAGTQNGRVFRIRSKGMNDPNGRPITELALRAIIEIPEHVDEPQKVLLRQLAEIEYTQVAPQRKSFLQQVKEYFTGSESASS